MYIVQPLLWARLLWYSKKQPDYSQRWLERYGIYKQCIQLNGIVLHAVSLGETLAAIPLIYALRKRYPNIAITITSMTSTGMRCAQSKFMNYEIINCVYLPYDLYGAMKRFVNRVQPRLVIVMETELWPNFIHILYQKNVPFIIVNARVSLNAFNRYKKVYCFIRLLMQRITLVAAQNKEHAFRFFRLGCKKNKLCVIGNLKFDIQISQDLLEKILFLKANWKMKRQIWIASSTHAGEEILLLQVHKKLLKSFPNLLMILVPRHPERFFSVQNIVQQFGLSYIVKSSGLFPTQSIQVVVGDTIGELMVLYGIADIAFVGGSLVKCGGHNPLEAAAWAIPVIMGPYVCNFSDICIKLIESNGLIIVDDVKSLIDKMSILLKDKKLCMKYGDDASQVLKNNRGVLDRLLCVLENYISK